MRRIILLMGCLLVAALPVHAGHKPPQIFLRVHVQSPGEGQSPMEVVSIQVPPDNETIQIRAIPEVSEGQLVEVEQDATTLRLYFNHVGRVDLSAATAQNQGRVLVVLLNGIVIYAPIIDAEIANGELDIPHPVAPQVLKLLQDVAAKNVREQKKS